MTLSKYYNRFDPAKNYEKSMFLAGRGLQSAELNEIQEYSLSKIGKLGDAIFCDGDVIKDATCSINYKTGEVILEAGEIYLRGAVRYVDTSKLNIPLEQNIQIGVWYYEEEITELEDPQLRDPALGTRNYLEPGACRVKSNIHWDFTVNNNKPNKKGEFYTIYNVVNGVLIQNAPPPQLDAVSTALARYDKEANGSYVVKGLGVILLEDKELACQLNV